MFPFLGSSLKELQPPAQLTTFLSLFLHGKLLVGLLVLSPLSFLMMELSPGLLETSWLEDNL